MRPCSVHLDFSPSTSVSSEVCDGHIIVFGAHRNPGSLSFGQSKKGTLNGIHFNINQNFLVRSSPLTPSRLCVSRFSMPDTLRNSSCGALVSLYLNAR